MKRYMAILGFVFVGILAGLLVRGIPIVVHVNAGGEAVATQNGDVNGDSMLDMSDAVYLLIHLFNGGPQPAAFAQMEPADLRGVEDSLESIAYNFDRFVGTQCEQSLDRFVWREGRTVVDTCKRLMWKDGDGVEHYTFNAANDFVNNLQFAGHSDWRLPTLSELAGLLDRNGEGFYRERANLPPFDLTHFRIWTSTTRQTGSAWQVSFWPQGLSAGGNDGRRRSWQHKFYLEEGDTNGTADVDGLAFYYGVLPVRDMGPEE